MGPTFGGQGHLWGRGGQGRAGRVIRVEGNVGLQVGWASLHGDKGLPGRGGGKAGSCEAH